MTVWAAQASPFDGNYSQAVCWSPELAIFVATGDNDEATATSPDGVTWTEHTTPGTITGGGYAIVWAADLSLFVASSANGASPKLLMTSPTGVTWTARSTPWDGGDSRFVRGLAWSPSLNLFVAAGVAFPTASFDCVLTSPDGVNWTEQTTAFADGTEAQAVCWAEELGLFIVAGSDSVVMTSADGVNWTLQTTPFDGGGAGYGACWSPSLGLAVVVGTDPNFDGTGVVMTSPDAVVWTIQTTPYTDGGVGQGVFDCDGVIVMVGDPTSFGGTATSAVIESADGSTWTGDTSPFDPDTGGYGRGGGYSPELLLAIAVGQDGGGTGSSAISSASFVAPTATLWTVEHYEHEFTAVDVGEPEIEENGDLLNTVAPESLHFLWQLAELGPSEIDYEISLSALDVLTDDPVVSLDFVRPYFQDWTLKRGTQTLLAGIITGLTIQVGAEHVKIAGKDWLHYLERRNWPYDADLSYINWPLGFRFKVSAAEIGQIVTDMIETVRDVSGNFPGPPDDVTFPSYSLKFVVDCDDTTITRNYEISAFETQSVFDLVRSLSQMDKDDGGFDFYMTPDRPPDTTFRLVYPEIGDPDTPIYTLEIDEATAFANMLELGYTDTGPEASHVLGVGAGTANRAGGVNKHLRIVSARTRRLDKVGDYGEVKNLGILESKSLADLQRAWRSIHEIPILVDPADIPDFWDVTRPGEYIMVDYDLFGHRIDSVQKIVSMDVTVDLEGNERVLFGLNQLVEGGATDVAADP